MISHYCKTPGCRKTIFGGADRCYDCRRSVRNKKQARINKRVRNKPAMDLSAVAPDFRKYVARIHEGN